MAQEIAKTDDSANKLPANAAQVKTGALAKQFRGDLSEKVDATIYAKALGTHINNPELLRKQNAWWDYVMCVMNAQREALKGAGKSGTLEEMVGTPANRTHFRGVLEALCGTAKLAGHSTVQLFVSVPPNDESLKVLDAALNGGAAMYTKQEEIKSPPPKFVCTGVGLGKFMTAGHVPELFAAAKARAEKLLPKPAQ